jgi:hypothetical protein
MTTLTPDKREALDELLAAFRMATDSGLLDNEVLAYVMNADSINDVVDALSALKEDDDK